MNFSQYVKGCALEVAHTAINIRELVSFLQNKTDITRLSLIDNNIGDKGAETLADGNLTRLTSLHLYGNSIGEKGAEALANGNLTNLTLLNLSLNKIGEKGAEALADGNLTRLTSLNLGWNKIGDKGAEALANGNLTRLTSPNLSLNKIGDKGVEKYILTSLEKRRNRGREERHTEVIKESNPGSRFDEVLRPTSLNQPLSFSRFGGSR